MQQTQRKRIEAVSMWQTDLITLYCAVCDNSSMTEGAMQRRSGVAVREIAHHPSAAMDFPVLSLNDILLGGFLALLSVDCFEHLSYQLAPVQATVSPIFNVEHFFSFGLDF